MQASGAFAPFRLANRRKALIVTYHRFSRQDEPLKTTASSFAEQLDYLAARYRIISLSELARLTRNRAELPPGLAVVTIDDGYRDAFEIALPILRGKRVKATLFPVTGFVDGTCWLWPDKIRFATSVTKLSRIELELGGRKFRFHLTKDESRLFASDRINAQLKGMTDSEKHLEIARIAALLEVDIPVRPADEFAALNWDQLRRMQAEGVEIGSHTVTHPILPRCGLEQLRWELVHSRLRLEQEIGFAPETFCYPNGDATPEVRYEVARAGYRVAVTTDAGLNRGGADLLALRRLPTERDMARFAQTTSGFDGFKNKVVRFRRTAALNGEGV